LSISAMPRFTFAVPTCGVWFSVTASSWSWGSAPG
jgi:hypothetical protein